MKKNPNREKPERPTTEEVEAALHAALRDEGRLLPKTDEEIAALEESLDLTAVPTPDVNGFLAKLRKQRESKVVPLPEEGEAAIENLILSSKNKVASENSLPRASLAGKARASHTKGIFYRRAAFEAYVVHALANDENLGRTKIEKITHLTEYHCGIDFEREPHRDAAGPVDYLSRRKVESLAGKLRWYSTVTAENRPGIKYVPGPKLAEALPTAVRVMGNHKASVDALIELMRVLDTKSCEIVATLFAAWNDLLLSGKTPTDQDILREARDNWHPKKLTIPVYRWTQALSWMRENLLIPNGSGRPVQRLKTH